MNQLTKAAKALAAKYNSTSLILRIAIGLVVGAVLALICPGAAWIEEFGNLFVGAADNWFGARMGFIACGVAILVLIVPIFLFISLRHERG